MINPDFKHYNPQSMWGLYNKHQLASDCVKLDLKNENDGERLIKELTVFFEKENGKKIRKEFQMLTFFFGFCGEPFITST